MITKVRSITTTRKSTTTRSTTITALSGSTHGGKACSSVPASGI